MAKAAGVDLPTPELERLVAPLQKLDETLQTAVRGLPSLLEPAIIFSAEEDPE